MDGHTPHLGEICSLATAFCWAVAVILFKKSGERVHPLALNLFKDVLGVGLFAVTMALAGATLARDVPAREYLLMLASGALGIGVGDTLFFQSLNLLGASYSAIVLCLYSPFVIGLSLLVLRETLTLWQALGAAMIVAAVLLGVRVRGADKTAKRRLVYGIIWGVLAEAAMAAGIVMVKPLLERSPLLWATEVRLFGGVAVLALILLLAPARRRIVASALPGPGWGYVIAGSFVGAYLSMVLWLAGMKYTLASLSSALNQTSNIVVFVLAAVFLREKVTLARAAGITLGVAGSFLVLFG